MTCNDFWGVTAVFASRQKPEVLSNLHTASERWRRQGLRLLIVELAIGGQEFQVPDEWADRVLRLRSDTVLWHKERMLNIGIASLPAECEFIAWIDGDILFENDAWVEETRTLLHDYPVVQPFETISWLQPGETAAPDDRPPGAGEGDAARGFAFSVASSANRRWTLAHYDLHGQPGFAWAVRRSVLTAHGLYDRAIMGMGDVIAAQAFAGGRDYLRGLHFSARHRAPRENATIQAWGAEVAGATGGRLHWTPGRVLHLHHPATSGRTGYLDRQSILQAHDFDPIRDIALDDNGCWRWDSDKPELHRQVRETFVTAAAEAATASLASRP